jgi:hypothetical protein
LDVHLTPGDVIGEWRSPTWVSGALRFARLSLFQRVLDVLEVRIVWREGLTRYQNRISILASSRKTVLKWSSGSRRPQFVGGHGKREWK